MVKIPFWMRPSSWGLKGKSYDIAEANYLLQGENLARRLVEIEHPEGSVERAKGFLDIAEKYGHIDPYTAAIDRLALDGLSADERARLAVDLRFGKIDNYTHDVAIAKLDFVNEVEQQLAILDIDLAYQKISKKDYDKNTATVRQEPWIGVIDDGFDLTQGINGVYFEFDWNEYWIEYLRLNGYGGNSEDEIVEQWFSDVCRTIVLENAEQEEFDPFAHTSKTGPITNRIDRGNGRADYT